MTTIKVLWNKPVGIHYFSFALSITTYFLNFVLYLIKNICIFFPFKQIFFAEISYILVFLKKKNNYTELKWYFSLAFPYLKKITPLKKLS